MTGLSKLCGLVVSVVAISSVVDSQVSAAAQRAPKPRRASGADLIGPRRIRPSDPTFKSAGAAILVDVSDIVTGNKIDVQMEGAFVWSETLNSHKSDDTTWFHKSIFWFAPDQLGERARAMSPAELAMAQTLFTQVNLSAAKNLVITRNGISGSVTEQELGLAKGELAKMTKARLQSQIDATTAALKSIGGQ
jgi:hypothetical protein